MNTLIPTGEGLSKAFNTWRRFSQQSQEFDMTAMMSRAVKRSLTDAEIAAYAAPFPSKEYQTAALLFPRLVPNRIDHPGAYDNRVAVEILKKLDLPVYLIFAEGDEITKSAEPILRSIFKNVEPPLNIPNAGHFIQEDAGEKVAEHICKWMTQK